MKHLNKLVFLVLIVMTLTSCDWLMEVYGIRKRKRVTPEEIEASTELVQEVESTELAKLIIKPTPKVLKVKRDPFKPLFDKKRNTVVGNQQDEDEMTENVEFLGVVKVGEKFSALLQINDAKGVFVQGEKVGAYTLSEITQEYIIFTKGEKTYKIKRGDE